MDLSRPVTYRGANLNTYAPVAGAVGAFGCILDAVDISAIQHAEFTERRRVADGAVYIEPYTALYPVTLRGTLYATTRGELYDALQVLREAFNPIKALMESPDTKGFLPLAYSEPHDDFALSSKTLSCRPLGLRWSSMASRHGTGGLRTDAGPLALQWKVDLLVDLDPVPLGGFADGHHPEDGGGDSGEDDPDGPRDSWPPGSESGGAPCDDIVVPAGWTRVFAHISQFKYNSGNEAGHGPASYCQDAGYYRSERNWLGGAIPSLAAGSIQGDAGPLIWTIAPYPLGINREVCTYILPEGATQVRVRGFAYVSGGSLSGAPTTLDGDPIPTGPAVSVVVPWQLSTTQWAGYDTIDADPDSGDFLLPWVPETGAWYATDAPFAEGEFSVAYGYDNSAGLSGPQMGDPFDVIFPAPAGGKFQLHLSNSGTDGGSVVETIGDVNTYDPVDYPFVDDPLDPGPSGAFNWAGATNFVGVFGDTDFNPPLVEVFVPEHTIPGDCV